MFRPTQVLCSHCTHTGLSPTMVRLSKRFWLYKHRHWPGPRSLATTNGVSVDFLSSGYLDVSVPRVCFYKPMYSVYKYLVYLIISHPFLIRRSGWIVITKYQVGSPIRKSMDQSIFSAPHSLSQSITSFIASYCLGIHQTPFSRLIRSRSEQK